MRRYIYLDLAIVALLLVPFSCLSNHNEKQWTGWERGYYTYQMGAIIDGVEYHEKYDYDAMDDLIWASATGKEYCCVNMEGHKGMIHIMPLMTSRYIWWSGPNKSTYDISFHIIADSASYSPGCSFPFNTTEFSTPDTDWIGIYNKGSKEDFESLPIVFGYVSGGDVKYVIAEGEITLGSFSFYYIDSTTYWGNNADRVSFSFVAESHDGAELRVEDGYINRNTDSYYVEYPDSK